MSNLKTVQEVYEAFGKGDVPAIIDKLDAQVDWEYDTSPSSIPWLQPLKGAQNVVKFFESLGEIEIQVFNVKEILEQGKLVVAVLDLEAKVKRTGKVVKETDEIHIWRFNDAGKVATFRHRADTLKHLKAWEN